MLFISPSLVMTTMAVLLTVPRRCSSLLLHPESPTSAVGRPVLPLAAGPARGHNAPPLGMTTPSASPSSSSSSSSYSSTTHTRAEERTTPVRVFCDGDSLNSRSSPPSNALFPYGPHLERELNNLLNRVTAQSLADAASPPDATTVVVRWRGLPR
jgi:hypothetical protein